MNLNQLRRTARWVEKIAVAQRQLADEVAASLAESESMPDPLGEHILESRRRYRRAVEFDKTKAQKPVDRELQRSYVAAMNLGFPGFYTLWFTVMRSGKSQDELARDALSASLPPPEERC